MKAEVWRRSLLGRYEKVVCGGFGYAYWYWMEEGVRGDHRMGLGVFIFRSIDEQSHCLAR